jgi:acetyltransferase-like isoleucine patch superfamily enzyme
VNDFREIDGALIHRTANIVGDVSFGEGSRIDAFVTITGPAVIGRWCHVGTGACIFGGAGFEMGDHSSLSPGAKVFTATEDLSGEWGTNPMSLPRKPITAPVKLGSHASMGAGSILLPGAEMPEGCILGALSMAKGKLTEWTIWAGVPAEPKKQRSRGILDKIEKFPYLHDGP